MHQIYNPYLPLTEHVPDGEPHKFNGRVYVYGSHDKPGGTSYCEDHYVTWSAPESDLTDWRYEGVIYRRNQDPTNASDTKQLWAPDVTLGPDGRYYLYYCFNFEPEIGVAVSDSPAGPFEFYGHVHYPNGSEVREHMPFDPAVLTDDDGRVYLYYGFAPGGDKPMEFPEPTDDLLKDMTQEEREHWISRFERMKNGFGKNSMVVELEQDMLTTKGDIRVLIPGERFSKGTSFEGHGFFEASSIRKVRGKYIFVYSSHKSQELCYAVSDKPDSGFVYGGIVVSNGDVGLNGRTEALNVVSNNHGGIVEAAGKYYIFYHRATNGTEFSRQGCAEQIQITEDFHIDQVEITSCGLNGGPLKASGIYPAAILCHNTCPTTRTLIDYSDPVMKTQTRVTQESQDVFVTDVADGSIIGYKYFDFKGGEAVKLELRGKFEGNIKVYHKLSENSASESLPLKICSDAWTVVSAGNISVSGKFALYFDFSGDGKFDLRNIVFE